MKKIFSRLSCFTMAAIVFLTMGFTNVFADTVNVVSAVITDTSDGAITDISGGNAKFTVTVSNASGIKLFAIMAFRDQEGQLLDVALTEFTPGSNDDYVASAQLENMEYDVNNYINCFLWDENLTPLIESMRMDSTTPEPELGEWVEANGATIGNSGGIMTISRAYDAGATTQGYAALAKYTLTEAIPVTYQSVTIEFKLKGNPLTWARTAMTFNNEAYYAPFMIFTDADLRFIVSNSPKTLIESGKWYDIKMVFNPTKLSYASVMTYDYIVKDDVGTVIWQGNQNIDSTGIKASYLPANITTINFCSRISSALAQAEQFTTEMKDFDVSVAFDPITINSVDITSEDTVAMGETLSLTATVAGTGNYSNNVTWSATNGTGSATISGSTFTPVSEGTVTLRATSVTDPSKYDEMTITITEAIQIVIDSVTITSANEVSVGSTLPLTATVNGTGNFNPNVTWSVTNGTGSATISGSTLTPVSQGTVTVTATSVEDPEVSGQMQITITGLPSITWDSLSLSPGTTNITNNGTTTVISRTVPSGTTTGSVYPSVARYTLPTPLSTNGQSITIRYTLKGEWLNWARIAMTFNTSTVNLNNPPMFIQNDGKTNFNWNSSTGVLDSSKWYIVTLVLNPTKAAYNSSSMSFSYEVKEEATGTVFTSGTKTPAAGEIPTIIPENLTAINWANRFVTTPTSEATWKVTFKDFQINP